MRNQRVIQYTQERLDKWYENAKIDYNINGSATVFQVGDLFEIVYNEDGVRKHFTMSVESVIDEPIDYLFNVWSEQAE